MFYQKKCSYKLQKIHRKHLCQSLLFNKVAGLRAATLLKKKLRHRCFPLNSVQFLRTLYLQNTSARLLLILFVASFFYFPLSNIFASKKVDKWKTGFNHFTRYIMNTEHTNESLLCLFQGTLYFSGDAVLCNAFYFSRFRLLRPVFSGEAVSPRFLK